MCYNRSQSAQKSMPRTIEGKQHLEAIIKGQKLDLNAPIGSRHPWSPTVADLKALFHITELKQAPDELIEHFNKLDEKATMSRGMVVNSLRSWNLALSENRVNKSDLPEWLDILTMSLSASISDRDGSYGFLADASRLTLTMELNLLLAMKAESLLAERQ